MSTLTRIEATDAVFAQLLGERVAGPGDAPLRLAPGGLIDTRAECSGDLAFLRRVTAQVRAVMDPCAWLYLSGGEAVCLFFFTGPPDGAGEVELSGGVAPAYQNRGHGVRIYRRFIDHLTAATPIQALRVQIFDTNLRSRRVHAFLGFEPQSSGQDDELGAYTWYRRALARSPAPP